MATILKRTANVTVTDITVEAKLILTKAMNNFCKPQMKKMSEKAIFIEQRKGYWHFTMGLTVAEATEKANEDAEWAF